jgi:hypothetical protein
MYDYSQQAGNYKRIEKPLHFIEKLGFGLSMTSSYRVLKKLHPGCFPIGLKYFFLSMLWKAAKQVYHCIADFFVVLRMHFNVPVRP